MEAAMAQPKMLRHGIGRFIAEEDYEYIGEFKNNQRSGKMGKCFCANGDFYAGGWRDDLMESHKEYGVVQDSILITRDGLERYFGQFKEGMKHGKGTSYSEREPSGNNLYHEIHIYKGYFVKDERHGKGELYILRVKDRNMLSNYHF
jgi:hypothetical protein